MDYSDRTIDELLADVASERVAPAGGTVTAIVGALGASLCEMVCLHAAGAGVEDAKLEDARDELAAERARLLDLADADAAVVDELFGGDGGEVDQSGLKRSVGIPLTVAESALDVLELAAAVTAATDRAVVADAATGAHLARSAVRASLFTVRSNFDGIADPSFVVETERRADEVEDAAAAAFDEVLRNVGASA
jgi:formiminotetrahydrofolate cyclodeaminase